MVPYKGNQHQKSNGDSMGNFCLYYIWLIFSCKLLEKLGHISWERLSNNAHIRRIILAVHKQNRLVSKEIGNRCSTVKFILTPPSLNVIPGNTWKFHLIHLLGCNWWIWWRFCSPASWDAEDFNWIIGTYRIIVLELLK